MLTLSKYISVTSWRIQCKIMFFRELSMVQTTQLLLICMYVDGGAWKAAVHGVAEGRTWLSDFTFTFPLSCTGEGNGNPLQCSCLENPREGGAWWAAVSGVTQSWTRLKRLSSSSIYSYYSYYLVAWFALSLLFWICIYKNRCHH